MKKYKFYNDCRNWFINDILGLEEIIDNAKEVTRRTFVDNVDHNDLQMLEKNYGYKTHGSEGLTMAKDYHVKYYRSTWHDKRVYFFVWSAIENVFVDEYDLKKLLKDF